MTSYEMETIISFNEEEDSAEIYTALLPAAQQVNRWKGYLLGVA